MDSVKVLEVIPATEGRNEILASIVRSAAGAVDLEFATLDGGDGEFAVFLHEQAIPLHVLGPGSALRTVVRLRSVIRRSAADVVQAHGHEAGWQTALATTGVGCRTATVVARHHNLYHHIARKRLRILLDRFTIRRVDMMVATSTSVGDTLVGEGCPLDRLLFATNGRDWEVEPDADSVVAHRSDRRATFRVVAVGNLKVEKDYPALLRAMARLVSSGVDAELVIAGTGSAVASAEIDTMILELGLEGRVSCPGWIPDVFEFVLSADVLVHASLDEASPQTVYEAAGFGVPIVATWAGGIRDILGRHQELVAPGDDEALALQVAAVLDDLTAARRRAGEIALDILYRYSADRCGASYLRACHEVMTHRAAGGS